MLGYAVVLLHPPVVLFAGFLGYAVSGPVITLVRRRRKVNRKRERSARQAPSQDEEGS